MPDQPKAEIGIRVFRRQLRKLSKFSPLCIESSPFMVRYEMRSGAGASVSVRERIPYSCWQRRDLHS